MKICQNCRLNLILESNIRRIISGLNITYSNQWRIQDFPEWRANSQSRCANLLFCNFWTKIEWKLKNLDPEEGTSLAPPWIRQCQ